MTNKKSLLKKYGSQEAISEHYREMQKQRKNLDGKKAAQTLTEKYGKDYFKNLGKRGGEKSKAKRSQTKA